MNANKDYCLIPCLARSARFQQFLFVSTIASYFVCACVVPASGGGLVLTVVIGLLSWTAFLASHDWPLLWRAVLMAGVVTMTVILIRGSLDVLWYGHEPVLHPRPAHGLMLVLSRCSITVGSAGLIVAVLLCLFSQAASSRRANEILQETDEPPKEQGGERA